MAQFVAKSGTSLVHDSQQGRRRRLNQRIKEINRRGDQELALIRENMEKAKAAFRSKKEA